MVSREAGVALVAEIHRAVHALGLTIARETNVTQAEALVLVLLHSKESLPLEEVHKAFLHRRSTLTNVLERLESRRLVRRQISPHDRRRFDLSLTPAGRRKGAELAGLFAHIVDTSEISSNEATRAREVLGRIVEATGVW